jgi:hypothetical protein
MLKNLFLLLPFLLFQACDSVSRDDEFSQNDNSRDKLEKVQGAKTIKHTEVWVKNYGTNDGGRPNDSVRDEEGNFYLAGAKFRNNIGKISLTKLDDNGTFIWTKTYDLPDSKEANAITIDQQNNLYLCGYTSTDHMHYESSDIFIMKTDPKGNLLWKKSIGSDKHDECEDIALDSQGSIYIVGETSGDLAGEKAIRFEDAFIAKLSNDGGLEWTKIFGTSNSDSAKSIMIDKKNQIFVGGSTSSIGDLYLAKYDTKGKQSWLKRYKTNDFEYDTKMTLGKDGYLYMGSKVVLRDKNGKKLNPKVNKLLLKKLDKNGKEIWNIHYGFGEIQETLRAIITDSYGNIYTAHNSFYYIAGDKNNLDDKTYLIQFNQKGKITQTHIYKQYTQVTNIFTTDSNDLFLIGQSSISLEPSKTFGDGYYFYLLKLKEILESEEG